METDDEFFEDFGSAALTDAQLEALLAESRQTANREMRLLVKQHQTLRHVAGLLLDRLERECNAEQLASDQVIKLARFVIRGEGGIGS